MYKKYHWYLDLGFWKGLLCFPPTWIVAVAILVIIVVAHYNTSLANECFSKKCPTGMAPVLFHGNQCFCLVKPE